MERGVECEQSGWSVVSRAGVFVASRANGYPCSTRSTPKAYLEGGQELRVGCGVVRHGLGDHEAHKGRQVDFRRLEIRIAQPLEQLRQRRRGRVAAALGLGFIGSGLGSGLGLGSGAGAGLGQGWGQGSGWDQGQG